MATAEPARDRVLAEIEGAEYQLAGLPWSAFVKRHRLRSELKRWRKALATLDGNSPAERKAGIIGRVIGGIIKG